MFSMARSWQVVALCAVFATVYVSAQAPHPLTDMPAPGLITTGYFLPDHSDKHFPAGKLVKVVLGIHNDASEDYNITAIIGSLNSPADYSMYIQNFTEQVYHQVVPAGKELSLEYKFMPDPRLEPRDFTVGLSVFYHDAAGKYFSNTFFNQTVNIVEVKKLIDWELIFLFVFLAGIAAGVVYLVYSLVAPYLTNMGLMRKSKRSKKTDNTRSADDTDEWVKGSNYEAHKKKKAAAAAKKAT